MSVTHLHEKPGYLHVQHRAQSSTHSAGRDALGTVGYTPFEMTYPLESDR
jgi:hypothetical protein